MKHVWEFILDPDVIASSCNFYFLSHIAKLINEGFYENGGAVRGVPVTIGGPTYVPPIPMEYEVKENIDRITHASKDEIDEAIELLLYCMKTQVFIDGNKRASVIFANHFMVQHGLGLVVVPESIISEFKPLLIAYYEDRDQGEIKQFLKEKCWRKF